MGDAAIPEEVRQKARQAARLGPLTNGDLIHSIADLAAEVAYAAGEDAATARIAARLREVGAGSLGPKPDTMSQEEFDSGLSLARVLANRVERDHWGRE